MGVENYCQDIFLLEMCNSHSSLSAAPSANPATTVEEGAIRSLLRDSSNTTMWKYTSACKVLHFKSHVGQGNIEKHVLSTFDYFTVMSRVEVILVSLSSQYGRLGLGHLHLKRAFPSIIS